MSVLIAVTRVSAVSRRKRELNSIRHSPRKEIYRRIRTYKYAGIRKLFMKTALRAWPIPH